MTLLAISNPRARIRLISNVAAVLLAGLSLGQALAQDYPTKPITMVVPFAAGGPSDVTGRILAQRLSELLGQQVIIDNVGGAGGSIAASRVAKAVPDGYQILLGNIGTQVWSQLLPKKAAYDSTADFEPVSLVTNGARVLAVSKDMPVSNLQDFIAYVRANQGKLNYASAGAGSASHIGCVLLNSVMGVKVTHIAYRGAGPAMQDIAGGRVDYMCDAISTAAPQVQSGAVRGIALLSGSRAAILPELPTAQEQGLKDFDVSVWQGIFLPKATPQPIIQRLAQAIDTTLDTPAVRERLEGLGDDHIKPERRGPAFLAGFLRSEIAKWDAPIKASGISSE